MRWLSTSLLRPVLSSPPTTGTLWRTPVTTTPTTTSDIVSSTSSSFLVFDAKGGEIFIVATLCRFIFTLCLIYLSIYVM